MVVRTFSIFGRPSLSTSCEEPLENIFSLASTFMATSRNALSKKGTRASRPHAIVDLDVISMLTLLQADGDYVLVSTETVRSVQVLDAFHALLVE